MNLIELPLVMVRENSVRTDELNKFQAVQTIELMYKYREKEKKMEASISSVAEEIEHYVKNNYDAMLKDCKKLIELKRNIFNHRYNKIEKCKEFVQRHTKLEQTRICVNEIIDLIEMKQIIEKSMEEECEKSRRILWNIWKNEDRLKCSLIYFDDNLSMKLKEYLEKEPESHTAKMKKLDTTLLKLYTRASLKPSPFSTLCGTKMMMDREGIEQKENTNKEKRIQINDVHIMRLWEYISRMSEVAILLKYKVNYSMRKEGEIYYISKLIDVPDENGKIYNGRTMLFRMPENEMMNRLYELRGDMQYTYDELEKQLGSPKEFFRIFQMLLDKKLIYCVERPNENSFDIIGDFLNNLKQWKIDDAPCVQQLIQTFVIIQNELHEMETSDDWENRRRIYKEIHQNLDKLYKSYGHEKWCDKNVVYEDYIQPEIENRSKKLSKEQKKTMELLCSLNLLFDVNVRTQTEFGKEFYEKYGNSKVHTSNATLISEMIHAGQKYNYLWENNMQTLRVEGNAILNDKLDELKEELLSYIKEKNRVENKDIIELDCNYLEELVERIPKEIKKRKRSYDFFLQFGENNIVVNNIYSGYSMYFSRFLQYYPSLWEDKTYLDYIDTLFNQGEKICDMRIASGFNGNIRPKLTKYELILPSHDEIEKETSIDYRDCYYFFDENEQRVKLYYDNIGAFTTLSLGSLMPLYLPGVTGILHSMFTNSLAFKDLYRLNQVEDEEITCMPRICIGDVVICRKSYMVKGTFFNEFLSEDGDFIKYFYNLNEKIKQIGMPHAVFVRKNINKEMSDVFLGKSENKRLDMTMRKPQFIDFYSPLLVKLFLQMFVGEQKLIIEEAYPNYLGKKTNVCEAVYEFSMIKEGE